MSSTTRSIPREGSGLRLRALGLQCENGVGTRLKEVHVGVEENEAALMRAVDAWNAGDVDAYLNLYDESLKLHAGTYDFPDKQAVGGMYRGMFAATSDL